MSEQNWGRIMARRRAQAAQKRAADAAERPVRPASAAKAPALHLYPMRGYTGPVPDRPIDWAANETLAGELSQRVSANLLNVLVMPTGFGKTIASLQSYDRYRSLVGHEVPLTVLAPSAVVKDGNWAKAIQAFNNEHPDRLIDPVMIESPRRFMNICAHKETKKKFSDAMGRKGVFIVDEVHQFKNPTAKQTKALSRFPHLRKIGLTGTPLTNDPIMDQISYLILAGKYTSKTEFMRETRLDKFVDMYGRITIYDKDTNTVNSGAWPYYDTMLSEISEIIYRPDVNISDITMPDVVETVNMVPESPDLNAKFRSLSQAKSKGAFETSVDYLMSALETLLTDEVRLDALVELVTKPGVHQPLVFFQHRVAADAIAERFAAEGITFSERSGHRNNVDLTSPDPILVQYQSGGTGVEVPDSTMTVFYENQRSYVMLRQAKGRNVRRGRTHTVEHHHLVAYNPFDYSLFDNLSKHGELNEQMMIDILEASMSD